MTTILITGMSGTGKTTVIEMLARSGYPAIETDEPGWCIPDDSHDSEWLWNEEKMTQLLDDHAAIPLVVSGCRANQGRFYDRFDHIVLFTAPVDVMLERVASRTTNPFGSRPEEREKIVRDKGTVEPLLGRSANLVIDTSTMSPEAIATQLVALL